MFFGAIGGCCIGCAAWQRSFNVMPHWSLTCALMAVAFFTGPRAFHSSLATVHHGKSPLLLRVSVRVCVA